MSKKVETKEKEIPTICSMKGKRSIVFKKAHEKAKKLESSGKILMSEDWKKIVSESWDEAKTEIERICSSDLAKDEESDEKLASDKDLPEEKNELEEEPIEDKQAVEQVKQDEELVEAASEQTSIEEKTQGAPTEDTLDE